MEHFRDHRPRATPAAALQLIAKCRGQRNGSWKAADVARICGFVERTRIPPKAENPMGWLMSMIPRNFEGRGYEAEELNEPKEKSR